MNIICRKLHPECPFGPNNDNYFTRGIDEEPTKSYGHIGKAMGKGGGFPIDSPTFKISMRKYEDISIKVGDKVTIEIKKAESSGI